MPPGASAGAGLFEVGFEPVFLPTLFDLFHVFMVRMDRRRIAVAAVLIFEIEVEIDD